VALVSQAGNADALALTPHGTGKSISTNAITDIQAGLATATNLATVAGYLDTEIAAILTDTNELQTDWANGGRLDAILDLAALGAGAVAGTGARTVTITVNDGTTALESASVRLTKGAETYVQKTSSVGRVTFNLDDGTWTVAISLAGYTYAGTTLVVDGDETATYSMTAYSISAPASPSLTTGYVVCLGVDGLPELGVSIVAQMTAGPGDTGYALDTGTITMFSDANGLAQYAGFVRGASYKFKRGMYRWTSSQTAPEAASWALAEILGIN
jgi:hypothetical protein